MGVALPSSPVRLMRERKAWWHQRQRLWYGLGDRSGRIFDPQSIRFYRSIDPDTYLGKIPPRKLVMIHSQNDTVIPYEYAEQTFAQALQPKILYTVGCAKHGYCTEMNAFLEKELKSLIS